MMPMSHAVVELWAGVSKIPRYGSCSALDRATKSNAPNAATLLGCVEKRWSGVPADFVFATYDARATETEVLSESSNISTAMGLHLALGLAAGAALGLA